MLQFDLLYMTHMRCAKRRVKNIFDLFASILQIFSSRLLHSFEIWWQRTYQQKQNYTSLWNIAILQISMNWSLFRYKVFRAADGRKEILWCHSLAIFSVLHQMLLHDFAALTDCPLLFFVNKPSFQSTLISAVNCWLYSLTLLGCVWK